MKAKIGAAVAALSIMACSASWAGSVPAEAMNKTITISFTATGMAKSADGKTHGFSNQISRMIYVSSAGRLFMRFRASNPKGRSRGGDFGPDDAKQGVFNFQGKRLVGVIPFATGARQVTVTFDPGFTSCTANVIEGHSNGVIRRLGPNGTMYEVTSATVVNPACSIQSGNGFAS